MEVNFAFLCDYADPTGPKLGALGIGIDTIFSMKVPAVHPMIYAVISISFSTTEVGPKQISMHLIDQDGKSVLPPLETTINIDPPLSGLLYRNHRIALAMHGVTFQHYGDYSIRWLVGGQEIKTIPLKVAPPPPRPTTA